MTVHRLAAAICGLVACSLLPGPALADDTSYDPVGKRDPFRPHQARPSKDRCTPDTPLLCYDLDQLRQPPWSNLTKGPRRRPDEAPLLQR